MAAQTVRQIFVAPPTPSPAENRYLGDCHFDLVHPLEDAGVAWGLLQSQNEHTFFWKHVFFAAHPLCSIMVPTTNVEASWNVMAHAQNQISSFGEMDESI